MVPLNTPLALLRVWVPPPWRVGPCAIGGTSAPDPPDPPDPPVAPAATGFLPLRRSMRRSVCRRVSRRVSRRVHWIALPVELRRRDRR